MLTNEGYYRGKDGLAVGSPPTPLLANAVGQVSLTRKYKAARKCISDIFRDIKRHDVKDKAVEINELHPSLKFSHNRDNNR